MTMDTLVTQTHPTSAQPSHLKNLHLALPFSTGKERWSSSRAMGMGVGGTDRDNKQ